MNPIEGITPASFWTFLEVVVGLAALAITVFKIIEFIWKAKDRKAKAQEEHDDTRRQPVEDVRNRLNSIDSRLAEIENKLDRDNRRLNTLEGKQGDISKGFKALCTASLAMLNHSLHNGNGEEMENAQKELQKYLVDSID